MTTTTSSIHNGIPAASYFLLGLLAGGAVAVLLAPCSGRETRGKIRDGVNQGTSKVKEGFGYAKRRSEDLASRAEGLINAGKHKLAQQGRRIEAAIEAGREVNRRESSQA